jgi:hypothetical protein
MRVGGLLERQWGRDSVTHQVDPAVDLVKAPIPHPERDLMAGHAGGNQLVTSDNSVLTRCERRDDAVGRPSE